MNKEMSILSLITAFLATGVIFYFRYDFKKRNNVFNNESNEPELQKKVKMPFVSVLAFITAIAYLVFYAFALFGITDIVFPFPKINFSFPVKAPTPDISASADPELGVAVNTLTSLVDMAFTVIVPIVMLMIFLSFSRMILSRSQHEADGAKRTALSMVLLMVMLYGSKFALNALTKEIKETNKNIEPLRYGSYNIVEKNRPDTPLEYGEYRFVEVKYPEGYVSIDDVELTEILNGK